MSEETMMIRCYVVDSSETIKVTLFPNDEIDDLRRQIKDREAATFRNVDESSIKVWKLNKSILIQPYNTLSARIPFTLEDYATQLNPLDQLSTVFPQKPSRDEICIVLRNEETQKKADDEPLPRVSRSDTVWALYEKLNKYHFMQVRGTPGTGKTSLCRLLARHVKVCEPTTNVITLARWSPNETDMRNDRWERLLCGQGWKKNTNTVLLFDEGQVTYNDGNLWNDFFKCLNDDYPLCRVILFTSYGSPSNTISTEQGTPMVIPDWQRVTLLPIQHDDNLPPVGLFFTEKEFKDLVSVLYPETDFRFDGYFFETLFDITKGHVGAIRDFVRVIVADDSYRAIRNDDNQLYTWNRFCQNVSHSVLVERLGSTSIFARGLPRIHYLQDTKLAAVFEAVLYRTVITEDDFTDTDEKNALSLCFRNGWLQSDRITTSDGVGFYFPSALHRWYIERRLWGITPSTTINSTSLLELSVEVIRLFSPQVLATPRGIGSGFIQRPPEAQYQDEFYRCLHQYSQGGFVTFPEYGTKRGWVDFYIPSKNWAVELLRDGDQLGGHASRFSPSGAYGQTIAITDYIILDFRVTTPQVPHPSILNLYHVVITPNFRTVTILRNDLEEVPNGHFSLLAFP